MKGPNAYDLTRLLVAAVEESTDSKPAAAVIKQRLLLVRDYPGVVGRVSVDSCGNSHYAIVTKTVTRGELQILDELPSQ